MEGFAEGDVVADRYRLGLAVGHGAMGEVHLAEDLRLARPVAIKSLRPELARYPDIRQRFSQEARAAARISHPNVVRIYDTGEEGRTPYLVMECLPGTTLVDELAWGTLEPPRARRVGLDVLGALDAAHRLGVVHRDVKPGNILLTAAIDGPVKVSDFGIAKSTDEHSITESGALVGTPAYLAPERVAGEPAGPRSDLYSLGVVLYEGLAGRRPYEAETSLALALAIHMGDGPDLLELRPDLDPALVAIVDKALARDPAERWASAAEMAEALRAWRPRVTSRTPGAAAGGAGSAIAAATAAAPGSAALASAAGTAASAAAGAGSAIATTTVAARGSGAGAPTVALAPGDLPAPASGPGPAPGEARPPGGARGFHLDDGSAAASQRRRRRIGVLCAGAAGLVLVGLLGLTALKTPGRAEPEPPPTSTAPVDEAPSVSSPDTSVLASPPSSATATTRRPARQARAPVTTAAPVTRPPTTAAPVRVTTTTRRTTTTVRATTTTAGTAAPPVVVSTPGA